MTNTWLEDLTYSLKVLYAQKKVFRRIDRICGISVILLECQPMKSFQNIEAEMEKKQ